MTGQRIGPFRIFEIIGAGGMGVVHRAEDTRLGRQVAIKFIATDRVPDESARKRFDREARAASALNHANICTVHDVGLDGDTPFLVLELLHGQSLKDRLTHGALAMREILDIAIPIADALEVAHAAGIVHRDLKPGNIFITDRSVPKLLDFGLAKVPFPAADDKDTTRLGYLTGAHTVIGTLPYMSPEQVRGEALDARTDLFSFGAVLYEMVTGLSPFSGETSGIIVENVLMRAPAESPLARVACPPALGAIINKALEKDRELRYQSARELKVDLRRLKESPSQPAATVVQSAPPPPSRRRLLSPIVATVVVLAVVGLWLAGRAIWPAGGNPSTGDAPAAMVGAPRVSPFLATPALERQPAWNSDASLVAYVSDQSGNDDIWICDASGAGATNLTASFSGVDALPAWSPDGTRIAFYSERDGPGIYVMTTLGAGVRKVVSLRATRGMTLNVNAPGLQWPVPDRLLYQETDDAGRREVYGAPVDGSAPSCLTCGIQGYSGTRSGQLSRSGELLAFLSTFSPSPLYVLDLRSQRVSKVADGVENPRWAGLDRLLFTSRVEGIEDIWEVSIDPATGQSRHQAKRVTSGLGAREFTVTADGRRILATRDSSSSHLWTIPAAASHVTDLRQGRRLTTGGSIDSSGRWTSDGGILFMSDRRGGFDIWRLAAGADTPQQLTTSGNAERPRISPDGRWITFNSHGGWPPFQWMMRPDGGQLHPAREKWDPYEGACCAEWSPDGTRLALSVWKAGSGDWPAVAVVDPATGRVRDGQAMVISDLPRAGFGRWSPDGRWIAWNVPSKGSTNLWITRADGQDARPVTQQSGNNRGPVWHAHPLAIFYRRDFTSIWRVLMNADGQPAGSPEPWLELGRGTRQSFDDDSLDINARGDQMLVTVIDHAADLWLVERSGG